MTRRPSTRNERVATRYALIIGASSRGGVSAAIKSNSRGAAVRHQVQIAPGGLVRCSCEDFTYRHAAKRPTILSLHVCRHIAGFRVALVSEALSAGLITERQIESQIKSLGVDL